MSGRQVLALPTVAPCLGCWGRGGGWGLGAVTTLPRSHGKHSPLAASPGGAASGPCCPPRGQVFIRQRAQAVHAAPGARGAGAMQTPSDSSRSGGETQQQVGQRVQGQKCHWGGRGSAVHRGWPGRPPEWAPCPCPEGLTKKAHVRLTVSEAPSGQRLESDRRAEAERDLGCFCACVGGSRQGRRGGAAAGFWIH